MKKKRNSSRAPKSPAGMVTVWSEKQPEHIIVFRKTEDKESVMRTLTKHCKGGLSAPTSVVDGIMDISRGAKPAGKIELFDRLGVAVGNLTNTEKDQLEHDDEVVAVIKNELRHVFPSPRPSRTIASDRASGVVRPLDRQGGPPRPFDRGGGPIRDFNAGASIEYARGYRDALIDYVDRLEGGRSRRSTSDFDAALQSAGVTAGLWMIGAHQSKFSGEGVRIAVLDTGLDGSHPDFMEMWQSHPERFASFVDGEMPDVDHHGHGTHVAGTVAGPANTSPRYGVAPGCELWMAKVLDRSGYGYDRDILAAIEWALDNNVVIVNLSLGSDRASGDPASVAYEAIASREFDREGGALFIAAAGNASDCSVRDQAPCRLAPIGNPAACRSMMAVAAVDCDETPAWFSSASIDKVGRIELSAPGVGIHSSMPVEQGRYGEMDGTSMAAPHVAGAAALWIESMRDNHDGAIAPHAIWDTLLQASAPLQHPERDIGMGLVQCP